MYDVWSERLEDLERAYLGGAGPAVGYNNTAAGVERKEVAESSAPPPPPFPSPEPAQEQEQDTHALLPRPPASNRVHPHRLVGLAEALDSPRVERLRAAIERQAGYTVELLVVSPSVWIGLLRNVPVERKLHADEQIPGATLVTVSLVPSVAAARAAGAPRLGPILVLVGLKYRGNVGTIVRAAVQANIFEAIHIVDERTTTTTASAAAAAAATAAAAAAATAGGGGSVGKSTKGAKSAKGRAAKPQYVPASKAAKGVTDKDIAYYSLCNAPLIEIKRFNTVAAFFENAAADEEAALRRGQQQEQEEQHQSELRLPPVADAAAAGSDGTPMTAHGGSCRDRKDPVNVVRREIIGVDGGTTWFGKPLNLYTPEAMSALGRAGYVAMGAEDEGLPDQFLKQCSNLVMIPCMSASINVGCAFTAVLTIMQLVAFTAAAKADV